MQQRLPIFVHSPPSLPHCGLCSSSLCAIHSVAACVSSFYLHCFCSRAHHFLHMSPPPPPTEKSLFSFICFASLVFLPFTSVQRSSFVYVVLSLTRRSPSLRSLCGRCSRSINFRWFVFCTCWVCVFENALVSVCERWFFFVYTIFFVGCRAATLTLMLASCFLGPPVEWFFSCCCYMCCTSVCVSFTWRHFHCIRHKLFITLSLLSLTFVSYVAT